MAASEQLLTSLKGLAVLFNSHLFFQDYYDTAASAPAPSFTERSSSLFSTLGQAVHRRTPARQQQNRQQQNRQQYQY